MDAREFASDGAADSLDTQKIASGGAADPLDAQEFISDGEEDSLDAQEFISDGEEDSLDDGEGSSDGEEGYLDDGEGSSEKKYMETFGRVKKPAEGGGDMGERCPTSGRCRTSKAGQIRIPIISNEAKYQYFSATYKNID